MSQTSRRELLRRGARVMGGSAVLFHAAARQSADVTITVSAQPAGVSAFAPGFTNADASLFYPYGSNDQAAIQNVTSLVRNGLTFVNTQIMAWGVLDPWPDPSQPAPYVWSLLDEKLQFAVNTASTPVITLCEAPWWMKGKLNADGTTTLLTQNDDYSNLTYGSRILDNCMPYWLTLVEGIAQRYMVAPYNVRWFQVWNELKGYYNPATNNWDAGISPGDPSGPNAKHGYTYMYNQVYAALKQTAADLGIDPATVKVGGPYNVVNTWSSRAYSNPSNFTEAYGNYDQRDLDVITSWLQNKTAAEFITVDGSNSNKDGVNITDPFTAAEKFADVFTWIRNLDPLLPIWFAEWYAVPYSSVTDAYSAAVKTYSVVKFLKAGGSTVLEWTGGPNSQNVPGLWTPTTAGGGQPTAWYAACQAIKQYFAPGTQLLQTTSSSSSIEVLASSAKTMLINKTNGSLTIQINSVTQTLNAYEVAVIDTPANL